MKFTSQRSKYASQILEEHAHTTSHVIHKSTWARVLQLGGVRTYKAIGPVLSLRNYKRSVRGRRQSDGPEILSQLKRENRPQPGIVAEGSNGGGGWGREPLWWRRILEISGTVETENSDFQTTVPAANCF